MRDYQQAHLHESEGSIGSLGIKTFVSCSVAGFLESKSVKDLMFEHGEKLHRALLKEMAKIADPQGTEKREWLGTLQGCFPANMTILVGETPNEYCSECCCVNRPWLIVTTPKGRIKIGPRKRVIEINWSDSNITTTAEYAFPAEDVTKDGKLIHAWGTDKAKEYIHRLLGAIP